MKNRFDRKIIFEDGKEFFGQSFGSSEQKVCEIVFNTSMAGYQEILSDPSYTDQAVVMTYPLIGNYGMAAEDYETGRPSISAMIVRQYNDSPSNFRSGETLGQVMERCGIAGISGVDTRALTRSIRDYGTRKALLAEAGLPLEEGLRILREAELPADAVSRVSCTKAWNAPAFPMSAHGASASEHRKAADIMGTGPDRPSPSILMADTKTAPVMEIGPGRPSSPSILMADAMQTAEPVGALHIVAIDCGMKLNIVRSLNCRGCDVTVVPWNTPARELRSLRPDGILVSNGPGDPMDVPEAIASVRALLGNYPVFGICLGHQILSLAYGAKTYKLKFGHRGGNHPVRDLETGRIEITSQNHSYAVDEASLAGTPLTATHVNLLDHTIEGVSCRSDGAFGVQYHPESAPGPQDSAHLFDRFLGMLQK